MTLTGLTGAPIHSGAWFGLPDLGVTEALQQMFTFKPLTAQGGSNLIGSNTNAGQIQGAQAPLYSTPNASYNTNPTVPSNYSYTPPTSTYSPPTSIVPNQPSGSYDQARNEYFSYLDRAYGQLDQTRSDLEKQVSSLTSGSESSIKTAEQSALGDIGVAQQKVESNKAQSLRDLAGSMRNQLVAGQRYLGTIPGSSNSTAVEQMNQAYAKVGNRNRSDLMRQANELSANLTNQSNKIKSAAQDQMQQLYKWRDSQLLSINNYVAQQRGQIDYQKANYIQNQLAQIDTQLNNYRQAIFQWAMNNSTTMDQLQQRLGSWAKNNPTTLLQPDWPNFYLGSQQPYGGVNLFGYQGKKFNPMTQQYE